MIRLLIDNPLLLLFLVAAVGYPLGRLRVRGGSFGVAAVLFVGLAAGSLHPDLKLPEIVYTLGLALFVYTVGLASGPAFFSALPRDGVRNNALVVGVLLLATFLAAGLGKLLGLSSGLLAGMFAGAFTNTPALAGALETIKSTAAADTVGRLLAEPVVGFSVAYPMGVIGVVLAIALVQKLWRIDYAAEAKALHVPGAASDPLLVRTIRITRGEAVADPIGDLRTRHKVDATFGRIKRGDGFLLAEPAGRFHVGDLVAVVGTRDDLDRLTVALGVEDGEDISHEQSDIDLRRIFVSNRDIAGRPLVSLKLAETYGAIVTRVRRGDDDFLPHDDLRLELGDRVRVLAPRDRMGAVSDFFGDSYRAVSEVDILTFSFGLALGLLLGLIPIPLPGGTTFKLGFAGGPLLVALVLGTVGRTGTLVWSLPYSANMTLRQIGLVLFLAGIGTRAGYGFLSTLRDGGGLGVFAAGATLTFLAALTALFVGHRLLKIPMSLLTGMVAGLFTQPAVLGYALERTENDLPNVGYASVYPVAMIAKILLVQGLLSMAGGG